MESTTNWKQIGDKQIFRGQTKTWRQTGDSEHIKGLSQLALSQSLTDFPPVRIDADCLLAIKIVTALLI